jgi:hypothetical protein
MIGSIYRENSICRVWYYLWFQAYTGGIAMYPVDKGRDNYRKDFFLVVKCQRGKITKSLAHICIQRLRIVYVYEKYNDTTDRIGKDFSK